MNFVSVDRETYSEKKSIAEKIIISTADPPIQSMKLGQEVRNHLNVTHNVNLKSDIIEFILNHPTFSKPFDLVKAIEDLKKQFSN